jgi:hypothetical protein
MPSTTKTSSSCLGSVLDPGTTLRSGPSLLPDGTPVPPPSSVSETLTPFEIEQLRQNKKEQVAYAMKAFQTA